MLLRSVGKINNRFIGLLGRVLRLPIPDKFFVVINRQQIELVVHSVIIGKTTIIFFQPHLVEAGGISTGIYYNNKLTPWGCGSFPVRVGDVLKVNFNLTSVN